MQDSGGPTLEQALAKTEADAEATLKAAKSVTRCVSKFRAAAKVGSLRELRTSIELADKAIATLRQQFSNAKEGWNFDEERYLAGGLYSREIIHVGQQMGVSIYERDERLYCYPVLIRVSSTDKAVSIDRKRDSRIRPSVLVARLKELQRKPPPFRSEAFLEALFKTYSKAVAMRAKGLPQMSPVIQLLDIYELLTLLPGQTREYTKQEFARDIYLLHRSGVDTTRSGTRVRFPASTGTKTPSKIITVITEEGQERSYYGVSFTEGPKEQ